MTSPRRPGELLATAFEVLIVAAYVLLTYLLLSGCFYYA